MPQFLIKSSEIKENLISLNDKETFFHLVKVLRIKVSQSVKFIDELGFVYHTKVIKINKDNLEAEIVNKEKSKRYLKNNYCLIQSILSNLDSQNLLIANATQIGVNEIYPVMSDFVSIKKEIADKKISKWEKIVFENFKQCERANIPKINPVKHLKEAIQQFKKENVIIFAERNENCFLNEINNIDQNLPIALVVGPEGGFSDEEFDYFKQNGYKLMTLGKMILKAPNAVVAGVSNVVSRLEND